MTRKQPSVYIIAGPNGAGKTTFAREFLPHYAKCRNFINADLIAGGLAPFSPEAAALHAGKLLLSQISAFARKKTDFGFETTLSGVTYLSLIKKLKKLGYAVYLYFLWIPTVKLSVERVRDRVRRGGHFIPEVVIRRRFYRGIINFFQRYARLADAWILFDNSAEVPRMIAKQEEGKCYIEDRSLFDKIAAAGGVA